MLQEAEKFMNELNKFIGACDTSQPDSKSRTLPQIQLPPSTTTGTGISDTQTPPSSSVNQEQMGGGEKRRSVSFNVAVAPEATGAPTTLLEDEDAWTRIETRWLREVRQRGEECHQIMLAATTALSGRLASRCSQFWLENMKRSIWKTPVHPAGPNPFVTELMESVLEACAQSICPLNPVTRCHVVSLLVQVFIKTYLENLKLCKPKISRGGGHLMTLDIQTVKSWIYRTTYLHEQDRVQVVQACTSSISAAEAVCNIFTTTDVATLPKNEMTKTWLAFRK
eukprot:TRINITY_DN7746_c0_g1::TRINITY_DN7746_c0_g1_i1::g.8287::m.8287 TRINITY_DN7746_c0_g1::TRINITY_DN7746_c0_g1_i1::g.8287  ORF type:complete len:281 (-),score=52.58,CCDC142/PF14923.1/2.8e-07 TRINITY_DN7746_c0_g1_i1:76-918(-)